MQIINIREQPQYTNTAIHYFQNKWATENSKIVYEDCITRSTKTESPLPIWYLLENQGVILGCAGLITNDFISCGDLWPWLCALYIEENHRGKALGSQLIEHIKKDTNKIGFSKLFLCTDLMGYYERYGFHYLTTGYHPWGESSRVYECSV